MLEERSVEISRLLNEANGGSEHAFDELIRAVYKDLRAIAAKQMGRKFNRPSLDGLTRQPTEIVQETVIRLMEQHVEFKNRGHFFGIATRLIVRVITDYQRVRMAEKRGGGQRGVALDESRAGAEYVAPGAGIEVIDILEKLEKESARAAEVLSLKAIFGYTLPEVAEMLDTSLATVERDWKFARAYFKQAYKEGS